MISGIVVTTTLDAEEIARIDALAVAHNLTREEMILLLLRRGLEACERDARTTGPRE